MKSITLPMMRKVTSPKTVSLLTSPKLMVNIYENRMKESVKHIAKKS